MGCHSNFSSSIQSSRQQLFFISSVKQTAWGESKPRSWINLLNMVWLKRNLEKKESAQAVRSNGAYGSHLAPTIKIWQYTDGRCLRLHWWMTPSICYPWVSEFLIFETNKNHWQHSILLIVLILKLSEFSKLDNFKQIYSKAMVVCKTNESWQVALSGTCSSNTLLSLCFCLCLSVSLLVSVCVFMATVSYNQGG